MDYSQRERRASDTGIIDPEALQEVSEERLAREVRKLRTARMSAANASKRFEECLRCMESQSCGNGNEGEA